MKERIVMILMFVLIFLGAVLIFGSAINNTSTKRLTKTDAPQEVMIDQEKGVFTRSAFSTNYNNLPSGNRTMKTYYNNRAYPGAPPMIPHPLLSEKGIGHNACLRCHQNGGYVPQFKAYAPISPHPDWINCKQCHLPIITSKEFKLSEWENPTPPTLGYSALITSPLVIPHDLQNRENCLSCHAGPAAPKEIRVSHPEKINCRQCHLPKNSHEVFFTPVESRETAFSRSELENNESH